MTKYIIKSGKGLLTLTKSATLVGLKTSKTSARGAALKQEYVQKVHHTNLGGFKIVALKKGEGTVDDKLDEVRSRSEVEVGTHVYFAQGSKKPLVPTGEIFIVFEPEVDAMTQQRLLDEYKLELVERRTPDRVVARVSKDSPNPIKVGVFLQEKTEIKSAEPDFDMPLDEYDIALPTDSLFNQQWFLKNEGFIPGANYSTKAGADAKVTDAWNRLGSLGSSAVTIAVIDNGFDLQHPDLKDKVFRPWDLWTMSDRINDNFTTPGFDTFQTHGTPCASLAVAAANGKGIVGVAPNSKFMPLNGTSFSTRTTEEMFDYCVKNGADVISCSWGTVNLNFSLNDEKIAAIAKAAREGRNGKGCVILFAAGNEGGNFVNLYAAHPDVICVAACDSKDRYARYSNQGSEVSICAPSSGDFPPIAARARWDSGVPERGVGAFAWYLDGVDRGSSYKHFSGTSAATPVAAGVVALILSANPNLTAKEVKQIIQQTADKIGEPGEYVNGHSNKFGYGRINADKAVAEALRRKDATGGVATGGAVTPPSQVTPAVTSGKGLFRFNVKRQASEGFSVQVGAFADYGNVLIQAEKLERLFGEPTIANISELNGKTVYKVLCGALAKKADADALAKRMKEAGVEGFVKNLKELA